MIIENKKLCNTYVIKKNYGSPSYTLINYKKSDELLTTYQIFLR